MTTFVEFEDASRVHIMLDLETMSLDDDAVVVAIGAVAFSRDTPSIASMEVRLGNPELQQWQIRHGAVVCDETKAWWETQPREARNATLSPLDIMDAENVIKDGIDRLREFIDKVGATNIWTAGPQKDIVWLDNLAARTKTPWTNLPFHVVRDYRTIRDTHLTGGRTRTRGATHCAVQDCHDQIEVLLGVVGGHYRPTIACAAEPRKPVSIDGQAYYEGDACMRAITHLPTAMAFAVKHLWRLGRKDRRIQDLCKSVWYMVDFLQHPALPSHEGVMVGKGMCQKPEQLPYNEGQLAALSRIFWAVGETTATRMALMRDAVQEVFKLLLAESSLMQKRYILTDALDGSDIVIIHRDIDSVSVADTPSNAVVKMKDGTEYQVREAASRIAHMMNQ